MKVKPVTAIITVVLLCSLATAVSASVTDAELERLARMAEAIDDRAERAEERLAIALEQGRYRRNLATYIEEEHRKARMERAAVERGLRDIAKAEQTALSLADAFGLTAGGGALLALSGLGIKRAWCGQNIFSGRPKYPVDSRPQSQSPPQRPPSYDRAGFSSDQVSNNSH